MARRKVTLALDEDLLAAITVIAGSSARTESDVVDDALRAYVRSDTARAAADVRAVMQHVAKAGGIDEATATRLALDEVAKVRRTRQAE